jgi:glyoxylase I family protein
MALEVLGLAPLLQVYDMPTSVRFYRDKLGFELVTTSPAMGEDYFHWCLLRLGGAEVMLNTAYEFNNERPPTPPDSSRVLSYPNVGLYFGCPDVDRAYEQFRAKGVEVAEPKVAPYGMKQMYLRDPDGYSLCFQWQA